MWLPLMGRALYTTGLALQAAMHSLANSSSSSAAAAAPSTHSHQHTQPQQLAPRSLRSWEAVNKAANLPELWLPILQDCIVQLGSTLQQLAAPDGTPCAQGSKQLRVVLSRLVFQAHTQLVTASAAAAGSACELAQGRAATATAAEHAHDDSSSAAQEPVVSVAWQQLLITSKGSALVDSLLKFGSLLCAALPTRFCCNEPSCCCLDKPSELHLAAGKGSQCSACGAARYCGAADQHKHWKQHKHVCKVLSSLDADAGQGKQKQKKEERGRTRGTLGICGAQFQQISSVPSCGTQARPRSHSKHYIPIRYLIVH
jgi:hypothetical protein